MKYPGKRVFDIVFSCMGIVLTSPILLLIAAVVKCTSAGPVLYRQVRVGLHGRHFQIWKFRSMRSSAEGKGLQITVEGDCRITGVGHILRKTKLDELPQLFNILLGQMSFVGPRPEVPKYVELYNEDQRKILDIRPGMTDYASICFRNESQILKEAKDPETQYIQHIMPLKIQYNLKYIKEMSLFTDLKIMIWTVYVVLGGKVEIDVSV